MTSPGRMARGLAIMIITLAIGAAVTVNFFDEFFANPPPVSKVTTPPPPPPPPPAAGITRITIPVGAQTQGNPDYVPDDAQVPLGNKVVWDNQDTAIHTATSGSPGADLGIFDTGLINAGEESDEIDIDGNVGDVIPYYCLVHPFMTGQITIVEAESGVTNRSPIEAAITIPLGAQTQGNPSYDPKEISVKQGNTILVINADSAIHTVTSGTAGAEDAGTAFDTGLIDPGASIEINTSNLSVGDYDYFCLVHPFMTGKLTITE
jgi:plastocyanin